jgi:hypothetical protein
VEHLKGASSPGEIPALPANIRLGWKGLPGIKNIWHITNFNKFTDPKRFITMSLMPALNLTGHLKVSKKPKYT